MCGVLGGETEETKETQEQLNSVIRVKEYDSTDKGSPDKVVNPPRDLTGHLVSVHATTTPTVVIDSRTPGESWRRFAKICAKELMCGNK